VLRTPTRLALYLAGLATVFGAAFLAASLVMPDDAAARWADRSPAEHQGDDHAVDATHDGGSEAHEEHGAASVGGTAVAQDGYHLGEVSAPGVVGDTGELSFVIHGPDGEPLTEYAVSHDKELHLVVVRSDGALFVHDHPTRDADGIWSLPWTWEQAGSYRVYADFVPAAPSSEDGREEVTLTRTVEVAGDLEPAPPSGVVTEASVDGYDVRLDGDLVAGSTSELTVTVTRDGEPVTQLQPYLGAFGHLVALREGDLAYLHVHPEGEEPGPGETAGPEIVFGAHAPTSGRYLLYLDFQVDDQVRTAAFVLEVTSADGAISGDHPHDDGGHG
jgi:hypothetical protein